MSNHRDLWYLRHWLQYWQLRTWIHDNLCYLTINYDTGQHSQFLRCFSQPMLRGKKKIKEKVERGGRRNHSPFHQWLSPRIKDQGISWTQFGLVTFGHLTQFSRPKKFPWQKRTTKRALVLNDNSTPFQVVGRGSERHPSTSCERCEIDDLPQSGTSTPTQSDYWL